VKVQQAEIHFNEQEDGDERGDLDGLIAVQGARSRK